MNEKLNECREQAGNVCGKEKVKGFDDVMLVVGDDGPFQRRFNMLFNFAFVFLATMPYLNFIISLAIPDHWCSVPGRESTNLTLEEWKDYTIPKENHSVAGFGFKKCKMYNFSQEMWDALDFLDSVDFESFDEIDCQHGWTYDTTWFENTVPMEQNWVCDKDTYVANTFAISRIGDSIGTFVFGQLGDIVGRKPVFFLTLVSLLIGRTLSAFTASSYYWFLTAAVIGSLGSTAVFQAPLVIAMEISRNEDRAKIAMIQCISWTLSISLMPFLMLFLGDWFPFMLLTSLPCALFFFSNRWIIESPRWLASVGKASRALKELEKIARINGTCVPDDAAVVLRKAPGETEKTYGAMSLFSSWRLAKNTTLIVTGWVITALIYFTLTLNVSNLGGSPYMNYFWQGMAEFPAYVLGKYASDVIGRRWTHIMAFLVTSLGCIPIIFTVVIPDYETVTSAIAVFIKFSISFAWYAVNLQALEIYPTCLRQTGTSLGAIMAHAFGILSPYIVYWGTVVDPSVPYVIASILCIGGALCGIFLPETLNQKLPETLHDAQMFGADQPFWNLPNKYAKTKGRKPRSTSSRYYMEKEPK